MNRELWELSEIPKSMREYFEEYEVQCGAQWAAVVEKGELVGTDRKGNYADQGAAVDAAGQNRFACANGYHPGMSYQNQILGYRPTCRCPPHDPVPATILDPFGGSGTVAVAAMSLGRRAILIELNPAYVAIAQHRIDRPHNKTFPDTGQDDYEALPLFSEKGNP